jgi:hypothetical protein
MVGASRGLKRSEGEPGGEPDGEEVEDDMMDEISFVKMVGGSGNCKS